MFSAPMPQNAIGKKIRESTVSPQTDDTTALTENLLPSDATFIRLMTYALTVEPARKASREASVTLGARAKI